VAQHAAKRLAELLKRPPNPTKRAHRFAGLPIAAAIEQYAEDRRAQVSERIVAWWKENASPMAEFLATGRFAKSRRPI
jgi:hypothetical protein